MDIAWILIVVAGIMEPAWVYTLESSDSFRNKGWAAITVVILIADLYLLSVAMNTLGAGMSYAVWTGIGAVSTFLMGVLVFKESTSMIRVACIFTIIAGIIGLNLVSGGVI